MRRLIHTEEELLRSVGLALRYSESEVRGTIVSILLVATVY